MMKRMMNFRLSDQAINTLSLLEKELHTSKTGVVEQALRFYAKRKLTQKHPLLELAGTLPEEEAEKMLKVIRENKYNKDIKVKL